MVDKNGTGPSKVVVSLLTGSIAGGIEAVS
jgi:hypothetical protein